MPDEPGTAQHGGSDMEGPPFPLDPDVFGILTTLWESGHAAYLVGGGVRDALLGRSTGDWDVATDARPERLLELFPGGVYENRFGTVLTHGVEITTFRRDHRYADHRRPERVTFSDDINEDLARRDLTINAIAWGRRDRASPTRLLDPADGLGDLQAGIVRAVGDPAARFDEDALRLLRAVRVAAALGFTIEPRTLAAMREHAADVAWLSGERVGVEVRRMLATDAPSRAFTSMRQTRILEVVLPEVMALAGRSVTTAGGDVFDAIDHSLATVDAAAGAAQGSERVVLAALLHELRPTEQVRGALDRMRVAGRDAEAVGRLVQGLDASERPSWDPEAVRRFMRLVGTDLLDDVLLLRAAHDAALGMDPESPASAELRRLVAEQRATGVPLARSDLAVNGDDLRAELGVTEGPLIGSILDELLESVLRDPGRNEREILLTEARRLQAGPGSVGPGTAHRIG